MQEFIEQALDESWRNPEEIPQGIRQRFLGETDGEIYKKESREKFQKFLNKF